MQENLVIVESPAKAKTIEKFLGKDFIVKSSFGHIRDISKKGLGIDTEKSFSPEYLILPDKKRVVDDLSRLSREAKTVWLASDEDREGEAIAWHLAEVLNLPIEKTKRIVFHEITKPAILHAIETPRTIDMNLVNAQQARRVLDRTVGFELSPVLSKKVRPALSAGRVQSVAVRLVVEREREIIGFNSTPFFRVVGQFTPVGNPEASFKAELTTRFETKEEAMAFLENCKDATFTVGKAEEKPMKRYPAAPFTTSTLQQEAGRKLGISVAQTMSIAQRLYEQGLITYMRTDSVNLSAQAIAQCKTEITRLFGEKYSSAHNYKTKTKGAQEAHEAIRPSYIDRTTIEGTATEKKLYDLIWKRTVASQMVAADVDRTTISIEMDGTKWEFVASGEVVRFDGFLRLYSESIDEDAATENSEAILPQVVVGEKVNRLQMTATERFTTAPARYNEASLVKRMEELGIGRPSTYAPTITTIINRGYVVKQNRDAQKRQYISLTLGTSGKISEKSHTESYGKEKSRLTPTDIGMIVNDYLELQFAQIMDYNFTANVEKEFDRIADGEITWNGMIERFYTPFHSLVDKAIETQNDKNSQVRIIGTDPATGNIVKSRIGRYGPMVEIEDKDGNTRFASLKKGQLIESITLEEAIELFALPRNLGEYNGEELWVGIGRYGAYIRQGKTFASLGKSDDPYTVTRERAIELLEESKASAKAASEPVKTFAEDKELVIKNGRYGAYIAYKGKNYRIPSSKKPEMLSYDECVAIVNSPKNAKKK